VKAQRILKEMCKCRCITTASRYHWGR